MTNDAAPEIAGQPPKVIWWFKLYCGFLCFLYVATAAVSLIFILVEPAKLEMPRAVALMMGVLCLALGLGLFMACLLPLVLRPRPWLWTYDLVIICLGMTSACFLPACIPSLIFWLKPETKRVFGAS